MVESSINKVCTKCQISKEIKYFRFRSERNYYHTICRSCEGGTKYLLSDKQEQIQSLYEQGFKICGSCKTTKLIGEFNNYTRGKHGLSSSCKECSNNRLKKISKWYAIKIKYNISKEQYNSMLIEQKYKCSICDVDLTRLNKRNIHLDHCHKTGKVRSILCRYCNLGLGKFHDNPLLLSKAITYLNKHQDDTGIEYCI